MAAEEFFSGADLVHSLELQTTVGETEPEVQLPSAFGSVSNRQDDSSLPGFIRDLCLIFDVRNARQDSLGVST